MRIFKLNKNTISKKANLDIISLGFWIMPNGKVINLGGCSHSSFVIKQLKDFNIDKEEASQAKDICKLAFDKGAVRVSILKMLMHNFFAIQGNLEAIYNHFNTIQKIYNESAPKGALIIVENATSNRSERFNSLDEIFEFASNKNIIKVAKNYPANGWIMPDGRVELLGLMLHSEYVYENIGQFGVSEEFKKNLSNMSMHDLELYRIAFKFGAIRFSTWNNVFSIQCTKEALRKNIEIVHRLYKRYVHSHGDICLDIVSLDDYEIYPECGKKITLEDLFEFASSNNWYKTAVKKGMSRTEKNNIEAFVEKIKKGYHNWLPEDIQLYQNNASIIEKLLRNEKVNWILMDQLDEEIEDLKKMLAL
jgi:hypothetical protein